MVDNASTNKRIKIWVSTYKKWIIVDNASSNNRIKIKMKIITSQKSTIMVEID